MPDIYNSKVYPFFSILFAFVSLNTMDHWPYKIIRTDDQVYRSTAMSHNRLEFAEER